ncbi:hypothetical protein N6P31_13865 [Pectobacterium betavasculorum]|uniref:hypothetical protein n=1 Tax=Pectobacterium betavasculorum TaxID=55207 RepID=UPI00068BB2CD|nr:hypothetical protein [Pectobacterium betavasculorum]
MANVSESNDDGFSVKIEHDFGYFLNTDKYIPITKYYDESAAIIKLNLIHENFLQVFISNLRRKGTEKYVKIGRYFMQNLEFSVALGLPVSIAECLIGMNLLRNKYAHDIDYKITDEDIQPLLKKITNVNVSEVNHYGFFKDDIVSAITERGIDAITFMNNIPWETSPARKRIYKLVAAAFCISNLGAFYLINELYHRDDLKMSRI